jgi:CBS domain-containing membrane protein
MQCAIDRLGTLRVRDAMAQQVVTVSMDQSLEEVAAIFLAKEISSAPVVDTHGKCTGVLSSVDFLKAQSKASRLKPAAQSSGASLVSKFMSPNVASIGPDELLLRAAHVMCARHIHRLPVLGPEGKIEGVISTMDIVSAMMNAIDEADAAQFGTRTSVEPTSNAMDEDL